jgi:hypothetical protein
MDGILDWLKRRLGLGKPTPQPKTGDDTDFRQRAAFTGYTPRPGNVYTAHLYAKPRSPQEEPRQESDNGSGLLSTIVAAEVISSAFDSSPSTDYGSSDSSSFGGGGDFDGGGSGGSW